jgi:hypothetical protein|tara:strand:- start:252 stop:416 length:165 start_codon:yes stop_codon:yes gene_type:complete
MSWIIILVIVGAGAAYYLTQVKGKKTETKKTTKPVAPRKPRGGTSSGGYYGGKR